MDTVTLQEKIGQLPTGKIYGIIGERQSYFVRRTETGYEIEAAWEVEEAYDDDHDSHTYHPFVDARKRPRHAVPWVGRHVQTADATEAADVYASFKALLTTGQYPTQGDVIGSVVR